MKLDKSIILHFAERYGQSAKPGDTKVEQEMKTLLSKQRFLTLEDLKKIGYWKSPRQKKRYADNDDATVREITDFSFSAKSEQSRIGVLLALNGVSYPVASVILHFAFQDSYSIIDFRALYSLYGWKKPPNYNFEIWKKYCGDIKNLSETFNLDIRTIDKALWQYSKENQNKDD